MDYPIEHHNNGLYNSTSNLNFNYRFNKPYTLGTNIRYNSIAYSDKITHFDLILGREFHIGQSLLDIKVNTGMHAFDMPRYYKRKGFHIGLSSSINYKDHMLGFTFNQLNNHIFDNPDSKMPYRFSAFLKNHFLNKKLHSLVIYEYQPSYFKIDPQWTFDIYESMNYYGGNLSYDVGVLTFGLGYKNLQENFTTYSANISYGLWEEKIRIKYDFSDIRLGKLGWFFIHQLGISFNLPRN